MKLLRCKQRGQALVMITTSLIALCGIMGLAVDLGWGYFVKKAGQRAADAAAMAAVEQALLQVGEASTFVCGTNLTCQAQTSCASNPNNPPLTNIDSGCLYAKQNGFAYQGKNGMQNVSIQANTVNPVPTAPGIHVDYWATVRVNEQIPQLFSAVLGSQFGWANTAARATAAVVDSPVPGSIYLINRENDPGASGTGNDLSMQGGGSLTSTGATYMASTANGSPRYAGHLGGSASVTAAFVGIRGGGSFDNSTNVNPAPTNGLPDQSNFQDPMRGKGQPPPPVAADAPAKPIYDASSKTPGLIDGTKSCQTLGPGSYYAVGKNGKATGGPITLSGCINFVNSAGGTSGFSNYVFFGGVDANNPGSVITMSPGRYILAGVMGSQNSVYQQSNGVTVQDQTPLNGSGQMVANTDAGELMVFTDANYVGGLASAGTQRSLYIPPDIASMPGGASNFVYGSVSVQMGNTSQSQFNLHGLNGTSADIPSELISFAPTVLWQDQGNSAIKYDSKGNVVDSAACGGGGTLDTPCANTNPEATTSGSNPSVDFTMQATPGLHLYGVFYQPRGASLTMQGSGSVSTPMVLITGSLTMGGSPMVLQPLTTTGLVRKMVALVE